MTVPSNQFAPSSNWLSRASVSLYLLIVMSGLVAFSVWRGTDTYYDLLNIKWYSGWSLITGNFDLAGIASTRITQPPINDGLQVLLNFPNIWWIPPATNALFHSLLVILVFISCRELLPPTSKWPAAIFASLSVVSPLVLMQMGTSSGHLYSALFLAGALHLLIRTEERASGAFAAGCLLGVALLFKSSTMALVPSLAVGAVIIVGSGSAAVALFAGIAVGYGAVAIPWSVLATLRAGRRLSQVGFPGVPTGAGVFAMVGLFATGLLGLAVWARRRGRRGTGRLERPDSWLFRVQLAGCLVLVPLTAAFVRREVRDVRFLISKPSEFLRRLFHTGDLAFGFETRDLEVGYFDTRVPLATALVLASLLPLLVVLSGGMRGRLRRETGIVIFCSLPVVVNVWSTGYTRYAVEVMPLIPVALIALGSMVSCESWLRKAVLLSLLVVLSGGMRGRLRRETGIVIFCSLPVVVNVWSTGYTRYAVEVMPLIPVALIALGSMVSCESWLRKAVLLFGAFVLLFPTLPNGRVSAGVPRFGQVEFTAPVYEPYLGSKDLQLISDLLPENSRILGVGSLISYVAPSLNRRDLTWSFERPSRSEIANLEGPLSLIYQPATSLLLQGYVDRGIVLGRCEVLRFDYANIGWCEASVAN